MISKHFFFIIVCKHDPASVFKYSINMTMSVIIPLKTTFYSPAFWLFKPLSEVLYNTYFFLMCWVVGIAARRWASIPWVGSSNAACSTSIFISLTARHLVQLTQPFACILTFYRYAWRCTIASCIDVCRWSPCPSGGSEQTGWIHACKARKPSVNGTPPGISVTSCHCLRVFTFTSTVYYDWSLLQLAATPILRQSTQRNFWGQVGEKILSLEANLSSLIT